MKLEPPGILLRVGVAVLLVLPITLLAVATLEGSAAEDGPLVERFTNLLLFFAALGPVLAAGMSILHTITEAMGLTSRYGSLMAGAVMGTLIVLPIVLEPGRLEGMLYGAFGGALYAAVLMWIRHVRPRKADSALPT